MDKKTIAAASCYIKKYYFNDEFSSLPSQVKKEIKEICVKTAEKIHGILLIGIYNDSSFFIEAKGNEDDFDYDEVGSILEVKKIEKENEELINGIRLWYKILYNISTNTNINKTNI